MAKTLILAIDGDLTSGQVLEGFLGEAYEVHWARSAMDGLEMAWASRPALILLNVELPDSSGFDLQLQLKRDVSLRDVPVIFLLKEMNAELESQALEMGAADCLVKPLHPRLLARKVGNVISREMLRVELARREADWRAILQTVPDLMFRIDRKGTYLSVFAHDASLLALPKRQLIGKSVFDVLPADAAAIIMEALAEAAEAGGSYGRVIELEFPDGVHWFELSVARAGHREFKPVHAIGKLQLDHAAIRATSLCRFRQGFHDDRCGVRRQDVEHRFADQLPLGQRQQRGIVRKHAQVGPLAIDSKHEVRHRLQDCTPIRLPPCELDPQHLPGNYVAYLARQKPGMQGFDKAVCRPHFEGLRLQFRIHLLQQEDDGYVAQTDVTLELQLQVKAAAVR